MFTIDTAAKAKKSARALEKSLAKQGIDLGHGHALNVLAAMSGFTDWNAMEKGFEPAAIMPTRAPSILDVNFTRVDRVLAFGSEYQLLDTDAFSTHRAWLSDWASEANPDRDSNPTVLFLESLNQDVYGSEKLTVTELLDFKWNASQQTFENSSGWKLSPLSAAPYKFDFALSSAVAQVPCEGGADASFSVLDIDFEQVTGLKRAGESFWVSVCSPAIFTWLCDWVNPANPFADDESVLQLSYVDDEGFVVYKEVDVEELMSLKWNPSRELFVGANGLDYEFAVQVPVGPKSPGLRQKK